MCLQDIVLHHLKDIGIQSNTYYDILKINQATIIVTFSNHSEILSIHKTKRECVWLRSMIQLIRKSYGLSSIKDHTTKLHEDIANCIA